MPDEKVYANDRTIVHAGDGNKHVAAPPDVCKTPAPSGPTPVPYVNVAQSKDLRGGTKRVKIQANSVAIEDSTLRTSSGNEPGSAGGLASGKTKGAMKWTGASPDVRFEGKRVVRFSDTTLHNGNTYNTAFVSPGATGWAYADDFEGLCPICKGEPDEHRVLETESSVELCDRVIAELRARLDEPNPHKRVIRASQRGYMVAAMICRCGQKWAAMSGKTTAGFSPAAAAAGATPIAGGVVGADEMWSANRVPSTASRQKFQDIWDTTAELALDDKESGYSFPGACAASKIFARAGGHIPASLTERYFANKSQTWTQNYRVMQTTLSDGALASMSPGEWNFVLRNYAAEKQLRPFGAECDGPLMTVASCHSCQAVLYMTMCNTLELSC